MELVKINASDYGLEETKAKEISEFFRPMLDTMESFEDEFNDILKLEVNIETCAKAKELRNRYVKVRTGTAKIHKDLKQFYLQGGRFVDGFKNAQLMASNGKEEKLMSIEKHFENIENERLENIQIERVLELSKYLEDAHERVLCDMDIDVWNAYLNTKKKDYEDKIKAEKQAELDRLEKERLEKEAIEKQRIENAKLKKEAELREEEIEKERLEYKQKEQLRLANEQKERAKQESILKKEQESKAKIELELKAKQDAELKAKQDAENLLQSELNKGDSEKINDLINDLEILKTKYSFKSLKNIKMYKEVNILIDKIIPFIEK